MQNSIIDTLKEFFGDDFQKKLRKADSLKELRKKLTSKKSDIEKKIKNCNSRSETKLLEKKLKVLKQQIKKINEKLD